MEIEEKENGFKRKKPLDLNWEHILSPTSSSDDDRPPELVITSKDGGGGQVDNPPEDLELKVKSDREIRETIDRLKKNFQNLCRTLPDKGQKLKANICRHETELARRVNLHSEKPDKEPIQISDHSDNGSSCGKKKGDQKSSSFANLLVKRLNDDQKNSRTVDAFDEDFSFINPCQGRKQKPKSQPMGKGKSKMALSSSRSLNTPLVDCEQPVISNDNKKDDDSTSLELNSAPDPPSRNLRPRRKRNYQLVDEDNIFLNPLPFMEKLDPCMKDVKVYYPTRDDPDSVEVNYTDMECLLPEACLSSIIMNFYIRYLQQPTFSPASVTSNYHFFSTYFYNKLEKLSYKEDSFLKFRKWWKGVSLFEKAYIILPIHENAHWSLVIICLPSKEDELGPILLHLDSLGLHNSRILFDNIKRFLKEEWSYLRKSEVALDVPIPDEIWENLDVKVDVRRVTVPQQKNDYDCGLFVLFYIERFIKEAPERFRKKDISMFGRQWFASEEASNFRATIYNLLAKEFEKAKEKESTESTLSPEI